MSSSFGSWVSALRVHYWVKNFLLFVPMVAGQFFDAHYWASCFEAFLLFCVLSSSIYLLNDIADRAKDSVHPTKKNRPIASGVVSVSLARNAAWVGITVAMSGSYFLLGHVTALLFGFYASLSWAYTHALKRQKYLDLLALSFLYLVRLEVGSTSTGVILSRYLLVFSFFLFLGLAALKRVAELKSFSNDLILEAVGRPYRMGDLKTLSIGGGIASCLSSVILVSYILDTQVLALYSRPAYLWGVVVGMSGWWFRIWSTLFQGSWSHDPVEFVCRDKRGWFWILFSALFLVQAIGR